MNEVEEIKNRLDIVEVVSGYVPLKQSGSNWKGLSPFKTEKTPSFMVSSDKGIWHDFSSGQGGDIFSFVMAMEGVEFREALELLAKKAGVELKARSSDGKSGKSKSRVYDAIEQAMKFYHLNLSKDQQALDYFKKIRGLKSETIKEYRLGYSLESWDSLSKYLIQKGFTRQELIDSGLVRQKSGRDSVYDMFRGRIMFPVFDTQARTVGFSARILNDNDTGAKYINTPESAVYHKSTALYGLMQAKQAIRSQDEVIIVEGNMDVLALANNGTKNVIASSGTALTYDQLKILSRLTKNIKLCFDQDEAGLSATLRALSAASGLDVKLMVVSYTGAKDPDELIRKDPKVWQTAVKEAQYAPDYIFSVAKGKFDTKSARGKKDFASFVIPTIINLGDDIETSHYVKKLAQAIDVSEESIIKKIGNKTSNDGPVEVVSLDDDSTNHKVKRQLTRSEKIERITLELMLSSFPARDAIVDLDFDSLSELHKPIFQVIKDNRKSNPVEIAKLLPKLSDYVKILSLRGDHVYSDISEHDARLEAFTQIHRLSKIVREKIKRQLSREISEAEEQKDQAKVKSLLKKYQSILNEE